MNERLVIVERWSSSPISVRRSVSSAISSRLSRKRRLPEVGVGLIVTTAGEADLTGVRAHRPGASREDDEELAVVLVERGQHGGGGVDVGERLALGAVGGTGVVEGPLHVGQRRLTLVHRQVGPRRGPTEPRRRAGAG